MMTPEQERKWRELEAAASPAPWVVHSSLVLSEADAAFLSAARDAVPALLAEVDALRAERDAALAKDRVSAIENAVDAYARHGVDIAAERDALRAELATVIAERDALRAAVDTYAADLVRVTGERDALRAAWMATPKQSIRVVCGYALTTDIPRWCVRAVDEWMDAMHKP